MNPFFKEDIFIISSAVQNERGAFVGGFSGM
jgi:hypothetical protein